MKILERYHGISEILRACTKMIPFPHPLDQFIFWFANSRRGKESAFIDRSLRIRVLIPWCIRLIVVRCFWYPFWIVAACSQKLCLVDVASNHQASWLFRHHQFTHTSSIFLSTFRVHRSLVLRIFYYELSVRDSCSSLSSQCSRLSIMILPYTLAIRTLSCMPKEMPDLEVGVGVSFRYQMGCWISSRPSVSMMSYMITTMRVKRRMSSRGLGM